MRAVRGTGCFGHRNAVVGHARWPCASVCCADADYEDAVGVRIDGIAIVEARLAGKRCTAAVIDSDLMVFHSHVSHSSVNVQAYGIYQKKRKSWLFLLMSYQIPVVSMLTRPFRMNPFLLVQFVTLPQIRPRRVDIRPTTRRSLFVNDEDLTKAFLAGAALLRRP